MPPNEIRVARLTDVPALASIALAAKASWGYSVAQVDSWRDDICPSAESVVSHPTFVLELAGQAVGFYQLKLKEPVADLVHLWVHPDHMRKGIGRALLSDACRFARGRGIHVLRIDSDPNAEPFYVACGAVRRAMVPAPIDGNPDRMRPQLELALAHALPTRSIPPR